MAPRPTKLLPYEQWPDQDRAAWEAAFASGDVFDDAGAGAHWSVESKRTVRTGYRRWLRFVSDDEPATLIRSPAERVTEEQIERYIGMLRASITAAGVFNYVKHLYDAVRVIAPNTDWHWLLEVTRRLSRQVTPRAKRYRMVDPDRLLDLGLSLMQANDDGTLAGAVRYRDGLIIALLACRPLRRRNIAGIRVDKNLVKAGEGYVLVFNAAETKNHQALEFPWPVLLQPHLEHYLAEVRQRFKYAECHDGLWASAKGRALGECAIYEQVCKRTRAEFGHSVNLHLFRDCAATMIAEQDPRHVRVSRDLLGHSRLETTDRYYNHAQTHHAALVYQAGIKAIRRQVMRGQKPVSRR